MPVIKIHCLFCFLFYRQMKSPAITTTLEGKNKTLYLQVMRLPFSEGCTMLLYLSTTIKPVPLFQSVKSIEERTRPNLCKTLKGNVNLTLKHFQFVLEGLVSEGVAAQCEMHSVVFFLIQSWVCRTARK